MQLVVIGAGRWGRNIIRSLGKREDEHITIATHHWRNVVRRGVDGVIVAAHPGIHLDVVKRCDKLGIPVMLEKPAALRLGDVTAMASADIPIVVDYTLLFAPEYQQMRANGGVPVKVTAAWCGPGPMRSWSALYDYGPHPLAVVLDLLGPISLRAESERGKPRGVMYRLRGLGVDILVGNGSPQRRRRLRVDWNDGRYWTWSIPQPASEEPLNAVLNHFRQVILGARPRIPFSFTVRLHKMLHEAEIAKRSDAHA